MRIPVTFYEKVTDNNLMSMVLDNSELRNVNGELYKVTRQCGVFCLDGNCAYPPRIDNRCIYHYYSKIDADNLIKFPPEEVTR